MDFLQVNQSLKRERYELSPREDIEDVLTGARSVSKLDADAVFHQIPLDEATFRICTFDTPF